MRPASGARNALLVTFVAALLFSTAAHAGGYTFALIADTGGPSASVGGPAINAKGQVAFWALLQTGRAGIFAGAGGPITTIATTGGFLNDINLQPSINDAGQEAFLGQLAGGAPARNLQVWAPP